MEEVTLLGLTFRPPSAQEREVLERKVGSPPPGLRICLVGGPDGAVAFLYADGTLVEFFGTKGEIPGPAPTKEDRHRKTGSDC